MSFSGQNHSGSAPPPKKGGKKGKGKGIFAFEHNFRVRVNDADDEIPDASVHEGLLKRRVGDQNRLQVLDSRGSSATMPPPPGSLIDFPALPPSEALKKAQDLADARYDLSSFEKNLYSDEEDGLSREVKIGSTDVFTGETMSETTTEPAASIPENTGAVEPVPENAEAAKSAPENAEEDTDVHGDGDEDDDDHDEEEDMEIDVGDNASKFSGTRATFPVKDLAATVKFEEDARFPYMYPKTSPLGHDLTNVHQRMEGRDRVSFAMGKGKFTPWQRKRAHITIHSPHLDVPATFGSLDPEYAKPIIFVEYETCSQLPCVTVTVDIKGNDESEPKYVRCLYYSTSVRVDYNEEGKPAQMNFAMPHQMDGDEAQITKYLPDALKETTPFMELIKANAIAETRIQQWAFSDDELFADAKDVDNNCQRTPPAWEGIEVSEVKKWSDRMRDDDYDWLSDGQLAAAIMFDSSLVQIYQRVDSKIFDYHTQLRAFMVGAMSASVCWGPMWGYELQMKHAKTTLNDGKFKLSKLQPIRILWKTCEVYTDGQGKQLPGTVKPVEWGSFHLPTVFPTMAVATFVARLGEYREEQKRQELIVDAMNNTTMSIFARFTKDENTATFSVAITIPELSAPGADYHLMQLLPREGEGFVLNVQGGQGLDAAPQFKGKFMDSLVENSATLTGSVARDTPLVGPHPDPVEDRDYIVELKLWVDSKPGNRKVRAIMELAKGQKRVKGIDLTALLFNVMSRSDEPGVLANRIARTPGSYDTMVAHLDRADGNGKAVNPFNAEQRKAVLKCWTTDLGAVLIHGPAGTGKSHVVTAAAEGFTRAGYTVAIVAHANSQVDNAMKAWSEMPGGSGNSFARARNVYFQSGVLDKYLTGAEDAAMSGGVGGPDFRIDGDDSHGKKMAASLTALSKLATTIGASARDFIDVNKRLIAATAAADKAEIKELRRAIKPLEEIVMPFVFSEVKVWFVTTNSAGHKTLSQFAKPDVVFVEEAGLSNLADIAVPFESFVQSAKTVILAGDWRQHAPIATSTERNEATELMTKSLFQRLSLGGVSSLVDEVSLLTQYRSHPDIMDPVADAIYKSVGLLNGENTKQTTPLQRTVQHFMQRWGNAYSGHMRAAVSVDGGDVKSETFRKSTSIYNDVEADYVANWIRDLLQFEPVELDASKPVQRVMPSDIGVSSPYAGQCATIKRKLVAMSITGVEIYTASQVQGKQFNVHVISFAKRNLANMQDTGFITDPGQLAVQLTRARFFQMSFGNFKAWANTKAKSQGRNALFYRVVEGFVSKKQIMSRSDFDAGNLAQAVARSSFRVDKVY